MAHSGREVGYLNVMACRHIPSASFFGVFDPVGSAAVAARNPGETGKERVQAKRYPKLEVLDVSFCWGVDDWVVKNVWACCPRVGQVKVFGDFGVKGVGKVPKGKILLGCPNLRGMEIEGDESEEEVDVEDLEDKLKAFEGAMGGLGDVGVDVNTVMGGL